jgi:hypothetical protein
MRMILLVAAATVASLAPVMGVAADSSVPPEMSDVAGRVPGMRRYGSRRRMKLDWPGAVSMRCMTLMRRSPVNPIPRPRFASA